MIGLDQLTKERNRKWYRLKSLFHACFAIRVSANIPKFLAKKTVNVSIGAEADIAVFNLRERKFGFTDVRKISI